MRGADVHFAGKIITLSATLGLAACGSLDMDSFRAPDPATLFRPLSVTNYKAKVLPPVGPEDMVDASGHCANAATPAAEQASAPADAGGLTMSPGIALEMSECDVVKRAGAPEKVDIGTNERGERTATLTYINGVRPGIYSFTAGRLKSMERAPEPPPVRAAKAKPAKKKTPNQHTAVQ